MVAAVVALEVRGVTRRFGARFALRGVSARFESGAITALTGGNGAGKTTLLGVLAGLLQPTHGELERLLSDGTRRAGAGRVGWVGHESLCYRALSGRRNVELAARLSGVWSEAAYAAVAERTGIGEFALRPVGVLSRGQRQRVALARALILAPEVLLLDEPTTGLDAASVARFVAVLREERARGAVVVLTTHSRSLLEQAADAEVRLERGRVASPSAATGVAAASE